MFVVVSVLQVHGVPRQQILLLLQGLDSVLEGGQLGFHRHALDSDFPLRDDRGTRVSAVEVEGRRFIRSNVVISGIVEAEMSSRFPRKLFDVERRLFRTICPLDPIYQQS